MQNYTGDSTGLTPATPVTISNPQNLVDPLTVETNNVAVNKLADFVKMLCDKLIALAGTKKVIGAAAFVGQVTSGSFALDYFGQSAGAGKPATANGTDRIDLYAHFDLPLGATITAVSERIHHDASGINTASCQVRKLKRGTLPAGLVTAATPALLTSPTLSGSAEAETFALTLSGTPSDLKKLSDDEYFEIHFIGIGTGALYMGQLEVSYSM